MAKWKENWNIVTEVDDIVNNPPGVEDLKKAQWYIDRLITELEKDDC